MLPSTHAFICLFIIDTLTTRLQHHHHGAHLGKAVFANYCTFMSNFISVSLQAFLPWPPFASKSPFVSRGPSLAIRTLIETKLMITFAFFPYTTTFPIPPGVTIFIFATFRYKLLSRLLFYIQELHLILVHYCESCRLHTSCSLFSCRRPPIRPTLNQVEAGPAIRVLLPDALLHGLDPHQHGCSQH